MPLLDRDYMRGEHPPDCTCADCVKRRLWLATHGGDTSIPTANTENVGEGGMWTDMRDRGCLYVEVAPPPRAKAGTTYTVDLYEKRALRTGYTLSWTQTELNMRTPKIAKFPISQEEYESYDEAQTMEKEASESLSGKYDNKWWRGLFSIEVHE